MRYEIHCHTNFSRCSYMDPKKLLAVCRKKGLDAVCIVDHDSFEGALRVEKINKDIERSSKRSKKLRIIKGIEFSTPIGHLIGLFLKKPIHYDKHKHSIKWLIDEIHKQEGIVILPHPKTIMRIFNITSSKEFERLDIDAIEAYNARNVFWFENKAALMLAKKMNVPVLAGSDAHFYWEIGRNTIDCSDLYDYIQGNRSNTALGLNSKEKKFCKLKYKNSLINPYSLYALILSKIMCIIR